MLGGARRRPVRRRRDSEQHDAHRIKTTGSAAGPAPSNTTLGGIGYGYIYTDWLSQIDYTTPDFAGFNVTLGAFDPLNSLSEPGLATTQPKKAPGFHFKGTFTMPFNDVTKLYVSVAGLTQSSTTASPSGRMR